VSLEDDLMRLFGSDRLVGIMDRLGLEEGQVIEHPWVSKSIEIAQRRVEQHNFEIRKQLLEYDNVINKQREVIYGQRREILEGFSLKEGILEATDKILEGLIAQYLSENQEWDISELLSELKLKFGVDVDKSATEDKNSQQIKQALYEKISGVYAEKEKALNPDMMQHLERMVFLQIIDAKWKDHLYTMDSLREGIGLRAYGQRDPLIEYRREAFEMFAQMISSIEEEAVETIFRLKLTRPERVKGVFTSVSQEFLHPEISRFERPQEQSTIEPPHHFGPAQPVSMSPSIKPLPKVGRNDPCPCGKIDSKTGKPLKYKKCCGR
jgi:preprotein translocase subunit SecA